MVRFFRFCLFIVLAILIMALLIMIIYALDYFLSDDPPIQGPELKYPVTEAFVGYVHVEMEKYRDIHGYMLSFFTRQTPFAMRRQGYVDFYYRSVGDFPTDMIIWAEGGPFWGGGLKYNPETVEDIDELMNSVRSWWAGLNEESDIKNGWNTKLTGFCVFVQKQRCFVVQSYENKIFSKNL